MSLLEWICLCAVASGIGLLGWWAWQPGALEGFSRWHLWRSRLLAARRRGHAAPPPSVRAMRAALPRATGGPASWPHRRPAADPPLATRLLFIGDASAGLPALLSAIAPRGPLQDAQPGEEPFWRWWRLPRLVAIELCPPPPPQEPPQDLLWLHALRTLAQTQPDRPLDGIVLCISTALLRADPKVAEPVASLLAQRVHETATLLNLHLPVHVLLTGLQDLPGYATVRAAVPAHLQTQALGWRALPPPSSPHAWEDATATWQASLRGLRLALAMKERTARERHDIHRFVEALLALSPSLSRLHHSLALDGHSPVSLQGMYLTAGGPQSAFVTDLFDSFLPMSVSQPWHTVPRARR